MTLRYTFNYAVHQDCYTFNYEYELEGDEFQECAAQFRADNPQYADYDDEQLEDQDEFYEFARDAYRDKVNEIFHNDDEIKTIANDNYKYGCWCRRWNRIVG